jgi:hypothetical protein
VVDGKVLWSKHETGRFPDEEELVADVKGIAG